METMLQNPFVALHNLHYAPVKSEPENGIVGLGERLPFQASFADAVFCMLQANVLFKCFVPSIAVSSMIQLSS